MWPLYVKIDALIDANQPAIKISQRKNKRQRPRVVLRTKTHTKKNNNKSFVDATDTQNSLFLYLSYVCNALIEMKQHFVLVLHVKWLSFCCWFAFLFLFLHFFSAHFTWCREMSSKIKMSLILRYLMFAFVHNSRNFTTISNNSVCFSCSVLCVCVFHFEFEVLSHLSTVTNLHPKKKLLEEKQPLCMISWRLIKLFWLFSRSIL